jgi:hypothetical protein
MCKSAGETPDMRRSGSVGWLSAWLKCRPTLDRGNRIANVANWQHFYIALIRCHLRLNNPCQVTDSGPDCQVYRHMRAPGPHRGISAPFSARRRLRHFEPRAVAGGTPVPHPIEASREPETARTWTRLLDTLSNLNTLGQLPPLNDFSVFWN